jgi:hypothetical protein
MNAPFLLRAGAATAAVLLASHWHARDAVTLLLPTMRSALQFVAGDFEILAIGFVDERHNASIGAAARLAHTVLLDGRAVVPDGKSILMAGTTIGNVLLPALVGSIAVLAWPAHVREWLLRIAIAAPLLMLALLLDTPFSLAAWLWDGLRRAHDPGMTSLLLWWNTFLGGGGRLVLGLVAATLAIGLARRFTAPRRPSPPDPS